jgi:hypothetical protein
MKRSNDIIDEIMQGLDQHTIYSSYLEKRRIQKLVLNMKSMHLEDDKFRHQDHNYHIKGQAIDILFNQKSTLLNDEQKIEFIVPAISWARAWKKYGKDFRNMNKYVYIELVIVNDKAIDIVQEQEEDYDYD